MDSAVAAALCCQAGYHVVAVSLRLWAQAVPGASNQCCGEEALRLASRVATQLGIRHEVVDLGEAFRRAVVDAFLAEVARGNTPNPCFVCNRLRIGHLVAALPCFGADRLVTGHYARLDRDPQGRWRLLRGVDRVKDQSYMLYRLAQEHLSRLHFPLGGLEKAQVRETAARLQLPVARRPDSVDLCWMTEDGLEGFLDRYLPPGAAQPGPIVDGHGRVVAEHRGLPYYTIGQRHGLGVAVGEPVYVVAKEVPTNALVIGPAKALRAREVLLTDEHWIAGEPPAKRFQADVQLRYRANPTPATILVEEATSRVILDGAQRAATPGQGLVAYCGDWCLGGGTIAAATAER